MAQNTHDLDAPTAPSHPRFASRSSGAEREGASKNLKALVVGSIGVVFGDIGTSPLYTAQETFSGAHGLGVEPEKVLGGVSLILWTLMALVTLKYVTIIMRADNRGEGGSIALLALVMELTKKSKLASFITMLGIFAAALFYGDSMITPAISVLSAVEGLNAVAPAFKSYILPISIVILCGLFGIQQYGTAVIGKLFGPVMLVWFAVIALLGIINIVHEPAVLAAINPVYGADLVIRHPWESFLALGSIFLAVTGGEALYADLGHFGRFPIRLAWFTLVLPALMLNYFGQAALLLSNPANTENLFYQLAPEWALVPMVLLATAATVIASQAVISGAFSVAQQAIQLGYLPRMKITHTSSSEAGLILCPFRKSYCFCWGYRVGAGIPVVEQLGRGLWHRRVRHDDHQHDHGELRCSEALEMARMGRFCRARLPLVDRRAVLGLELNEARAGRMVCARDRDCLVYDPDDMEARAGAVA